jgi:hypothetical protein
MAAILGLIVTDPAVGQELPDLDPMHVQLINQEV